MTPSPNIDQLSSTQLHQFAALLRDHMLAQADVAYQNARMDGLCADGAWELTLDTLRTIDLEAVIQQSQLDS